MYIEDKMKNAIETIINNDKKKTEKIKEKISEKIFDCIDLKEYFVRKIDEIIDLFESLSVDTYYKLRTLMLNEFGVDIQEEIIKYKEEDPASANLDLKEILLSRQGILKTNIYRILHFIYNEIDIGLAQILQVKYIKGCELHPGAIIGKKLLFDHTYGTVIGETAIVGDNSHILHNVTLGGTNREIEISGKKIRHPILLGDNFIGAGAYILGPSIISKGVKVGSLVRIINRIVDLPEGSSVVKNLDNDGNLFLVNNDGKYFKKNFKKINKN